MKLIIVGNGFDLEHGAKSKYSDFKEYLIKKGLEKEISILEDFFSPADLWSDFEDALGRPNLEFKEKLSNIFGVEFFPISIKDYFEKWSLNLNEYLDKEKRKKGFVTLFNDSIFINFNYTQTLEYVYEIEDKNILHIHGVSTGFPHDLFPICFGHGIPKKW